MQRFSSPEGPGLSVPDHTIFCPCVPSHPETPSQPQTGSQVPNHAALLRKKPLIQAPSDMSRAWDKGKPVNPHLPLFQLQFCPTAQKPL